MFSQSGNLSLEKRILRSMALAVVLAVIDRKSTRLNSSHSQISYAVFCLKKKKKNNQRKRTLILYGIKNASRYITPHYKSDRPSPIVVVSFSATNVKAYLGYSHSTVHVL